MDSSARFWDRMASTYSKKPVPNEAVYQRKLEVTREYLKPDMDVLEFGCGTGSTALAHAPYVRHIQAIDISGKMIDIAREKAKKAGVENVEFSRAELFSLALGENTVDAVLGLNILHLLPNWEDTVQQVYKLLKPGGVFISSTACIADAAPYIRWIAPFGKLVGLMPALAIFTHDELKSALTNTGFSIDHKVFPEENQANCFLIATKPVQS